jgi:dihydrofolate synthase/folylpolyglutamate synthase
MLENLGNPQNGLKYIHVAGTNGKGSICMMLSSILVECNYKVGLFISPFVVNFRERMQINGEMISKADFARLLSSIIPFVKSENESATEFEVITAIAFQWFREQLCDIVILETGLGGRLDATNIIKSTLISVITSISFDHTEILGKTIKKIAKEKCGIIKPGSTTILYPSQSREVHSVVRDICQNKNSKLRIPDLSDIKIIKKDIKGIDLISKEIKYHLPLLGTHQIKNLSVVFAILDELEKLGWKITPIYKRRAVENIKIPARMEIFSEHPLIILDGAHNPSGIDALVKVIKDYITEKKVLAVFGLLAEKNWRVCLKKIVPLLTKIIVTKPNNIRACEPQLLADFLSGMGREVIVEPESKTALKNALALCNKDDALLIFGSLYLASEIRPKLTERFSR